MKIGKAFRDMAIEGFILDKPLFFFEFLEPENKNRFRFHNVSTHLIAGFCGPSAKLRVIFAPGLRRVKPSAKRLSWTMGQGVDSNPSDVDYDIVFGVDPIGPT
ncbi:hypothetical protein MACH10_18210 [Thalassospira tepidiphila]|nr:hypothetical protein MACH10_18210 [Thalassospira tepidiphila]